MIRAITVKSIAVEISSSRIEILIFRPYCPALFDIADCVMPSNMISTLASILLGGGRGVDPAAPRESEANYALIYSRSWMTETSPRIKICTTIRPYEILDDF